MSPRFHHQPPARSPAPLTTWWTPQAGRDAGVLLACLTHMNDDCSCKCSPVTKSKSSTTAHTPLPSTGDRKIGSHGRRQAAGRSRAPDRKPGRPPSHAAYTPRPGAAPPRGPPRAPGRRCTSPSTSKRRLGYTRSSRLRACASALTRGSGSVRAAGEAPATRLQLWPISRSGNTPAPSRLLCRHAQLHRS